MAKLYKYCSKDEKGFIPMILFLLAVLVAAIVFAYLRVKSQQSG